VALGLLAPLNLLAGLAVVVPIAVHLLQRKREATVDFPAVRFLLLAQRRSSRRVRVRRLLLLLVRCLAVLLFALLLARPVLQAPGAAFREGEPGFTVVILDTSLSMTALAADGRPRFEAARDLARKIASPAGARERFALVAAAPRPGQGAAAPRWLDADNFASAVGAAAACPAVVEPARAFAAAYRLLRETGAAQRRIIVISDFARGGWDHASLGALPLFDASVPVRLLRLGGDGARNRAGIVRVSARGESRVAGEPRVVRAEIVNAGPEQVLPVEFWLDDKLAASRLETVQPGTSAAVEFTLRPASAGAQRVEVRLPADRYPADDRRLLGIDVAAPVSVLAIDGEPGASLTQSETFFLQEALRPERMALTAPVRVAIGGPEMPVDRVPAGTAVVIAANVRAPGEKAGKVLADYVAAGGSLLVFWGGACDAEAWRRALPGLLPAAVAGTEGAPPERPWRIGEVDYSSAPLAVFRPPANGTFATASFTLRARLERPAPAARVLARFEDGAPWLIEHRVGRGRVVFCASTADLEGNDLATRPVYVPLVQRLVLWLADSLEAASDVEQVVGEPLEFTGGAELVGTKVDVESPSGVQREVEFRAATAGSLASAGETGEIGFYRWSRPGRAGIAAVNVPAAESDLVPLGADEIEERLRPVRFELFEVSPAGAAADPARLGVRSLTRPLLLALLAVLLLETVIAGPRAPWRHLVRSGRPVAPE